MSKSKHTPGPWIVVGSWIIEADQRSIGIARVARQCSDEQAGANALLLAAAPALAEALRNFVDYYTQAGIGGCADGHDDDDDDGPFSGDERYNVRHARAALAAAGIKE